MQERFKKTELFSSYFWFQHRFIFFKNTSKHFVDLLSRFQAFVVKSSTRASDLCQAISQRLNMKSVEGFSLFVKVRFSHGIFWKQKSWTTLHYDWNHEIIKYRNGNSESSVICRYVCQSVLFVQPIRSLNLISMLVLCLFMKITRCLLVLFSQ